MIHVSSLSPKEKKALVKKAGNKKGIRKGKVKAPPLIFQAFHDPRYKDYDDTK